MIAPAVLAVLAAACGPTAPSPTAVPATAESSPSPATALSPAPSSPVEATPTKIGFAFSVDAVAGYYLSIGYTCTEPRPSTTAAGHEFRSCQLVDGDGRTLVVGLVTDPAGLLANAFASVQAPESATFLEPTDALQPLAAFLGAMLGESRGESLLPWLAGHLGDVYAETTIGSLRVATYTESADDRTKLYLELATPEYLESPTPAPS